MNGRAYESFTVDVTSNVQAENNKCSAVTYVDGQAQTLLLTSGPKQPPPDVLALCQLSALPHSKKCRLNTFKQFVLVLRDPPLLGESGCGSPTKKLAKQPGSSPTCSDLRTNNKQLGLKTITNQIENQPANHARSTTNVHRATHAENYANGVKCDTDVCSETHSDLLAQQRSHSSGLCCWRFIPAASRRHDPRRFQILCVVLHYTLSSCNRPIIDSFPDFSSSFSNSA